MGVIAAGTPPDVRIRAADADDAAVLAELGARTFRDTYLADNDLAAVEAHIAATYATDLQTAELADPSHHYLLAEVAAEAVGFALLRDEQRVPGVAGRDPTMLAQLYVDRPFQSKGVGAALMARCLDDARSRGHDVVGVTVWERNSRAIAFYRRCGFVDVGDVVFVLGDEPQRDRVMARPL